jgi:hypothetical protein
VPRQNLVRSHRPPPGRSSPATGTDGRPYQRPRLSPQKESARLRDLHTETSCHSDNCSPYSISDFRVIDCIAIGLGMKSRLPIDNPGAWLGSGVGRAFHRHNLTEVVGRAVLPLCLRLGDHRTRARNASGACGCWACPQCSNPCQSRSFVLCGPPGRHPPIAVGGDGSSTSTGSLHLVSPG